METRDKLKDMIAKKNNMEEEITQLYDVLKSQGNVGMTEPLVDTEGFPRNDIDVYQVRSSRNKISCLQNDHKSLMEQIEEELHNLHSESKPTTTEDIPVIDVIMTEPPAPFASINLVSSGSPAENAGLMVGDEIIQFGSVNVANFQSLQSIATVVQHSEGRNVEIKVSRGGNITRLMLTPKRWSGRGLLGCNLIPFSK